MTDQKTFNMPYRLPFKEGGHDEARAYFLDMIAKDAHKPVGEIKLRSDGGVYRLDVKCEKI